MAAVAVILMSLLAGCYTQDDFAQDLWAADCERVLECYSDASLEALPYDDVDACLAYNAESIEDTRVETEGQDCRYDAGAAEACVAAVTDASCEDFLDDAFRETCEAVCGE